MSTTGLCAHHGGCFVFLPCIIIIQVFASCCAPPGGGRNEVSPRLLRQFAMIWLTNLTSESMTRIFTSILGGFLALDFPNLVQYAEPIVKASVNIYER